MKNLVLFILISMPFFASSQDCNVPVNNQGVFEIVKIIETTDSVKSNIYRSCMMSLAEVFKSSDDVIEFKDQEQGIIYGKFNVETNSYLCSHFFKFDFKLEIKEKKYRIQVKYLNHKAIKTGAASCGCPNDISNEKCGDGMCMFRSLWASQRCQAIEDVSTLVNKLQDSVTKNLKKSDW